MADLTTEQRDALAESDFAVPGKRELPIQDEHHVRLAWDMVDRTQGLTPAERQMARTRILRKAKDLGIDTKTWNKPDNANHAESSKKIEIFKAGRHTSMSGDEIEFSAGDLHKSAAAYDPSVHEAPIVVGHPRTDDPAYGWVSRLTSPNGSLFAELDKLDPAFVDMVHAGRFKKVSASFYTPNSPQNPAPGVYYLRHVGFLGAQPPAIKGLKPVAFLEDVEEEGVIEFGINDVHEPRTKGKKQMKTRASFHEKAEKVITRHLRRIREHLIRKHGQAEADEVIPSDEIDALDAEARRSGEHEARQDERIDGAGREEGARAYAESPEMKKREEDLRKREDEFAKREKALKDIEIGTHHAAHLFFCEDLVKAGKMLPANKANIVSLLDYAEALENPGTVEFGEGADRQKLTPIDALKAFLTNQPKLITYSERINAGDDLGDDKNKQREAEIQKYMEANRGATYREAYLEIGKKFPALFDL